MLNGYLALLLHAHLPFVRHPEHASFLEEGWLYEAIIECYLPLLEMLRRLEDDRVDYRLTISLSPPLLTMLSDQLLQNRFVDRISTLIDLAGREALRTRSDRQFHRLAAWYRRLFTHLHDLYENTYRRDLVSAFKTLVERGRLELITSCATHAYLPLLGGNRAAMRAQITTGMQCYAGFFGSTPQGLWLPECGYDRDVDGALQAAGIRYTVLENHGVLHARPRPRFGVFAPVSCPSGVAAFARDTDSSKQVWSAHGGYPGDHDYREFYRDIGYDCDYDYIRPYLPGDGIRSHTGIKYYRITGTEDKKPYDPDSARRKAARHAEHFMSSRRRQAEQLFSLLGRPPVITAPFDAELFGHWWFEGPVWLEQVIRLAAASDGLQLTTLSECLSREQRLQPVTPSPSSWGWQGYSESWLNGRNDWIYPLLHEEADRMAELARKHRVAAGLVKRALNQAARELLLAQSSDWAFIMTTGTASGYAEERTRSHLANFSQLCNQVAGGAVDEDVLSVLEGRNTIFPDMDYRVFTD